MELKRECCNHLPDIHSWWPKKHNYKIQQWEIVCPICHVRTNNYALSAGEAIVLWENKEIEY